MQRRRPQHGHRTCEPDHARKPNALEEMIWRIAKRLRIIAIADLAANEDPEVVGSTVSGISEPSGDR